MPPTPHAPPSSRVPTAGRAQPGDRGQPETRWLRAVPLAAWSLVAALGAASVIGLEPNLVEEGLVLHVAERLAHGEHLYRDVVFFTGPLPFELLAALFRIFGAEIAVGRVFMVGVQAAATGVAFAFARRAGAGAFAHAAAAVVAALAPAAVSAAHGLLLHAARAAPGRLRGLRRLAGRHGAGLGGRRGRALRRRARCASRRSA